MTMSDYECEGCGLAAMDLPDGVDPEFIFAPDQHGITWCQGCRQTIAPVGERLSDWAS